MKFVKLTRTVLIELKSKGYTTLHSTSHIDDKNPTWMPYRDNVKRILDLDSEYISKISFPMEEKFFIIIDDAIKNIDDSFLLGQVFICNNDF